MPGEIQRGDAKRNDKTKEPRIRFGRGSKVKRKWVGDDGVYTLVECRGSFWTAQTPTGYMTSIHENNIDEILVDGHWRKFDGNTRHWQRVY